MKHWRDAASIIFAAKSKINQLTPTSFNYKLLTLKRHKDSSFLPENYVFPGGVVEKADGDLKWKNLYKKYLCDDKSFTKLFPKASERPQIYQSKTDELPREISLRITAIRETFEECGILICRPFVMKNHFSDWARPYILQPEEVKHWQQRVHNDPSEFYEMCKEMQILPDVWTLYEWSNWLTPTFLQSRFDTAFFVACSNFIPDTHFDNKEMQDLRWDQPDEITNSENKLTLAPPQHFELAKIVKFSKIEDFLRKSIASNQTGTQQIFPVRAVLSDGVVYLLPGDALYPKDQIDSKEMKDIMLETSLDQFSATSEKKNRMELSKSKGLQVVSDFLS